MIGSKYENGRASLRSSSIGDKYDSGCKPQTEPARQSPPYIDVSFAVPPPQEPGPCFLQPPLAVTCPTPANVFDTTDFVNRIVSQITDSISVPCVPSVDTSALAISVANQVVTALIGSSALADSIAAQVVAAIPGVSMPESFSASADSISVVSTVETTILTSAAPADWYLETWSVSAQPAARYKLKVNDVVKATLITTVARSSDEIEFGETGLKILSGEVVTITGYHEDLVNKPLSTNIAGHLA